MILTINAGSTSLKYKLFNNRLKVIGGADFADTKITKALFKDIEETIRPQIGPDATGLKIAHRVVHGGLNFRKPTRITPAVIRAIKKNRSAAPLHNPHNLKGIQLTKQFFPNAKHYAVFDTDFFQTLPIHAAHYPLITRFQKLGFHGISHEYMLMRAKVTLKKPRPNLITLHLGAGSSITAIKKGKAIDTSMGYSPLEGLMMWSRPGDIDPYIIFKGKGNKEQLLNHQSGIKAISGCKNYLEVLSKYKKGDKKARLALDMFVYRIQKYIGAYFAALGGQVEALVFSGAIGAGDTLTRQKILTGLTFLKKVRKLVVAPNEELMMAQIVAKLR